MGKSQQRKGASGEREFIAAMQQRMPHLLLSRNVFEQRVKGGMDIVGLYPFAVEIKRVKGSATSDWFSQTWWNQACAQAVNGRVPLLAYRFDRKPWRVVTPYDFRKGSPSVMTLDDFCNRYRDTYGRV